jgi:hypothetical protein
VVEGEVLAAAVAAAVAAVGKDNKLFPRISSLRPSYPVLRGKTA